MDPIAAREISTPDFGDRTLMRGDPRSRRVAKRLTFPYGRTHLIGRILLLIGMSALLIVGVALSPEVPWLTVVAIAAVLVAYLILFTVSPLLTEHWLTRSRLILRQGWYFRAIIPFSEIESISAADDAGRTQVPLGIHRPLGQPALFVTGGRTNLVALRLRHPRRFWQAFGLFASEIIFDVGDRDGFLAAFEERRSSLPPVQADGTDAELRD
jgi:hypothetical protein